MISLQEIAETLRAIADDLDDQEEASTRARQESILQPIPKPHAIYSVSVPVHLVEYDNGMWHATSPVIPGLNIQSSDQDKLVETLVPEAVKLLAAGATKSTNIP